MLYRRKWDYEPLAAIEFHVRIRGAPCVGFFSCHVDRSFSLGSQLLGRVPPTGVLALTLGSTIPFSKCGMCHIRCASVSITGFYTGTGTGDSTESWRPVADGPLHLDDTSIDIHIAWINQCGCLGNSLSAFKPAVKGIQDSIASLSRSPAGLPRRSVWPKLRELTGRAVGSSVHHCVDKWFFSRASLFEPTTVCDQKYPLVGSPDRSRDCPGFA